MKQRRRDRFGRLDSWLSRKKPHLFQLTGGSWFCTALTENGHSRGASGPTPWAAYNALMTFIAKEYFKR